MSDDNWQDLITCLRFVANQSDPTENKEALALFAEIIRVRPYDTSRIMAILCQSDEGLSAEGNSILDLARLDCDRGTDFFMLKFLLCN